MLHDGLADLNRIGFICFPCLVGSEVVSDLRAEALLGKDSARAVASTSGTKYRARMSGLGDAGRDFLSGDTMTGLVGALFEMPLEANNIASCYTHYQPGDFLEAHVDHAEQCVVTAILYLDVVHSNKSLDSTGLELHILDAIPSGGHRARRATIPTKTGALVLGLGSVHWHERPMLQEGEYLTAMTACYSVPSAS
jgi:hypothetical protein